MVSPQDLPVCGFTGICSKLCTFELIFLVAVLGHVLVCSKLCTFWAYIFGCNFGPCFGCLMGGAIYIYTIEFQ